MKTLEEIHNFWRNPNDKNLPETYVEGERSKFLLELISNININKESSILELGCNVGRNLNILYINGYTNLSGIEININAKPIMKTEFPFIYNNATLYWNSIENIIKSISQSDIIFTMAVLEHIHPDSEWIFKEMFRKTNKYIITIEDECVKSNRHFVRNYKDVFEDFGTTQIYEQNCMDIFELGTDFFARIFIK
jgi:SAM-dependent methyltransferase